MTQPEVPTCIGFIMDGNRRWAKEHNLPTIAGHTQGGEAFATVVRAVRDRGIAHAVFYAFSSENWNRPKEEVDGLIELMGYKLKEIADVLKDEDTVEKKVGIRFIGDIGAFSPALQQTMRDIEARSKEGATTTIWIALSYGGRAEIVRAVNSAFKEGIEVTEETFARHLYTADMPDPDIIVRTGGQQRLSNFLPWQSVYSELIFLEKFWPDMTAEDLDTVLKTFADRTRNFGS